MIHERVEDPGDPRLADYFGLTDPARRGPDEQSAGIFVAEGRLVVERLLGLPLSVRSVLITEDRIDGLAPMFRSLRSDVRLLVVPRAVAERVTGYDVHRGILAVAERPPPRVLESIARTASTVVVLEDLTDQVNIGAIFRNAAALGADAVLLSPSCADPLYRRAVRVSMGAALSVPFCRLTSWPDQLEDLRAANFLVMAMTPDPRAEPLDGVPAGELARVALVLGTEGAGLSGRARSACDREVRIEMAPGADSLNVATAAAVALYSIARRREAAAVNRSSAGP